MTVLLPTVALYIDYRGHPGGLAAHSTGYYGLEITKYKAKAGIWKLLGKKRRERRDRAIYMIDAEQLLEAHSQEE